MGWSTEHLTKKLDYDLTTDIRTGPFIPDKPQLMARRARNIRDRVTRSHFTHPKVSLGHCTKLCSTFPCCNGTICPFILSKTEFLNPTEGRNFKLCDYTDYCAKHMVYGILCPCPIVYVGQIGQELRKCIQQHLPSLLWLNVIMVWERN